MCDDINNIIESSRILFPAKNGPMDWAETMQECIIKCEREGLAISKWAIDSPHVKTKKIMPFPGRRVVPLKDIYGFSIYVMQRSSVYSLNRTDSSQSALQISCWSFQKGASIALQHSCALGALASLLRQKCIKLSNVGNQGLVGFCIRGKQSRMLDVMLSNAMPSLARPDVPLELPVVQEVTWLNGPRMELPIEGRDGPVTLREWIEEDVTRGTLGPGPWGMTEWRIPPESLKTVRRALHAAGLALKRTDTGWDQDG